MMTRNDAELRALYARLQADPSRRVASTTLAAETIQALADGSYRGADRENLLDLVLADPAMGAEFRFFHAVAGEAPRPARYRVPFAGRIGLAAAAVLVIALGARTLWREPAGGPLRGTAPGVLVLAPGRAAPSGPVTFTWRPVASARDYSLEVARADGTVLVQQVTRDTSVTAVIGAGDAGELQWWVTVRRDDGTSLRSGVQPLEIRRP